MTIHKEGYSWVSISFLLTLGASYLSWNFIGSSWTSWVIIGFFSVFFLIILQFFRNPSVTTPSVEGAVYAPADGKVVVIEHTEETEYFKDRRLQVSIFMSPFNVHVNRSPIKGIVSYFKYHPGLFLVAWHPKSSTENERTTVVVKNSQGVEVLFRQIAGALARRIRWYVKEGNALEQGQEFGFIKFGSRVDIFLPPDTEVCVDMNQVTKGGQTIIAKLK